MHTINTCSIMQSTIIRGSCHPHAIKVHINELFYYGGVYAISIILVLYFYKLNVHQYVQTEETPKIPWFILAAV